MYNQDDYLPADDYKLIGVSKLPHPEGQLIGYAEALIGPVLIKIWPVLSKRAGEDVYRLGLIRGRVNGLQVQSVFIPHRMLASLRREITNRLDGDQVSR